MVGNPNWKKGVSGNPNGRPPKHQALTALLSRAASKTILIGDKRISRKQFIANEIWRLLTEGEVHLMNGRILAMKSAGEWVEVTKWLYAQVDGLPRQPIDLATETIQVVIDR